MAGSLTPIPVLLHLHSCSIAPCLLHYFPRSLCSSFSQGKNSREICSGEEGWKKEKESHQNPQKFLGNPLKIPRCLVNPSKNPAEIVTGHFSVTIFWFMSQRKDIKMSENSDTPTIFHTSPLIVPPDTILAPMCKRRCHERAVATLGSNFTVARSVEINPRSYLSRVATRNSFE